jgi:hypothetical protein
VDARLFIRDSAIYPLVLVKLRIPRAVRVVYNFFWTGMEVGVERNLSDSFGSTLIKHHCIKKVTHAQCRAWLVGDGVRCQSKPVQVQMQSEDQRRENK